MPLAPLYPASFGRMWGLVVGLLLLSPLAGQAQTTAPKYSNEFLKIGVGARAAALGNAVTAWSDDATAAYWNPAALGLLTRRHQVSAMHSEYFAGVAKYDYLGYATRIDSTRSLGIAIVRLGIDDIPNTLNIQDGSSFNFARITAFSVADLAIIISYAQRVRRVRGLTLGGSFKIIHRSVGPFGTAWGFGLDAGVLLQRGRWRWGASVSDVTSTFNLWSFNPGSFAPVFAATGNVIPDNSIEVTLPSLRLGVARQLWTSPRWSLATTADVVLHFDGPRNVLATVGPMSIDPRLGVELGFRQRVYVRAGAMGAQYLQRPDGSRQFTFNPAAGLGLNLPLGKSLLTLDYALTNSVGVQQGLYSHLIALSLAFDRVNLK